jgi:hypothetical protein
MNEEVTWRGVDRASQINVIDPTEQRSGPSGIR